MDVSAQAIRRNANPPVPAGPPGDWRRPTILGAEGGPLLYSLTGSDENLFPNALTDTPQSHIHPAIWAPMGVKLVHQANRPTLFHDHLPRPEAGELFPSVTVFFLLGLHSLVPHSPTIRQVTKLWPTGSGQKGRHHLQTWAPKCPRPPRQPNRV